MKYLKRFDKEMFKVEKFIELVPSKDKWSEVTVSLDLYAIIDKSMLKVKHVMQNHIRVKKASMLRYEPFRFY
jgi:hypothetical protein